MLKGQILGLSYQQNYLYTELIGEAGADPQKTYWVRPLFLAINYQWHNYQMPEKLIKFNEVSDLLLPMNWFRVVEDVEFIPLLTATENLVVISQETKTRELNIFIKHICQQYFPQKNI